MKIAIVGNGIVGGSLRRWIEKNHDYCECEVLIYDPGQNQYAAIHEASSVFISVPVPTRLDATQDYSILESTMTMTQPNQNIYIRSTVLPGTADSLALKYSRNVYAMPEFLTERTADADLAKSKVLVGGGLERKDPLFEHLFARHKEIIRMSNTEAEMAKYAHNCFGALKVTFFNHIYKICKDRKLDYQNVLHGTLASGYINRDHTQVPGPDGHMGFGGTCFPKDLKAFAHWSKIDLLKQASFDNEIFRGK